MASTLLTSVAALSDSKCMATVLKWQGQHRTPLHIAVMHGNVDLCNFIFQKLKPEVVRFMCVKEDNLKKIPVNYAKGDTHGSIGQQLLLFTLQGLCDNTVRTMKAIEEGDEQDDSTAQALESSQTRSCKSFLSYLSGSIERKIKIAQIRDTRGYNMAHIAAEANDFDLLKGLFDLKESPFHLYDIIHCPSVASKMAFATTEANELKPDNVLAVALWGGCHDSMRAIVAHHLNGKGHGDKERRIVFNYALRAYVKKMLAAFKQRDGSLSTDDFIGDSQDLHVSEVMVKQFSRATRGDLELSWSFEWLGELTGSLQLDADEAQIESTYVAGNKNKNKSQIQPQRACSMRDLLSTVLGERHDSAPAQATKISLLHYAVAASLPYVVEALVLSGHGLPEDSHGLNPYDYLVLLLRLMLHRRQGCDDADPLNSFASVYPDRFRDLKACFGSFFAHADENKQFVATLSKFVPSTTMHKGWKKGRASGTALHVACLLQDSLALNTILRFRTEKSDTPTRLGLRQTIRECEKGERELASEMSASSPHSRIGGCRSDASKTDRTYLTGMFSYTPIGLAVRCFLIPTAAGGNREVLRLLLLCAHRNQCLASILQDLTSELDSYSPYSPEDKEVKEHTPKNRVAPDLVRNLVNMLFHRDELEKDWQSLMEGRRLFDKYDTSTIVTLPCDQFTFGAPTARQKQGRWYYEVEFTDGLLEKEQCGVFIGWASESFSQHSSSQVGGAPCSWAFTPRFNSKKGEIFSQLRLGGSARKSETEFGDCLGIGVLIDLQTNKISWRVIHKDRSFSWVRSDGPNHIALEDKGAAMPTHKAQFDLGAWRSREHEQTLMPCMSCYVARMHERAVTVYLSGKFNAPLPSESYPAIVLEDGLSESILPLKNEFGNSPCQAPPFYKYDHITLVHLAVMQGDVDLAEDLVEKYGALYLPMLNLRGDHCTYDYESLEVESKRKCVSHDFDSLPYQVSESKGLHRRITTARGPTERALKRVHEKRCGTAHGDKDGLDSRQGSSSQGRKDNQKLQHAATAQEATMASTLADTTLPTLFSSGPTLQGKAEVLSLQSARVPETGEQAMSLNAEIPGSVNGTSEAEEDLEAGTARKSTRRPSLMLTNRSEWQESQWC
eukprot:TRINITY_DN10861_c0_g1_i1.p1 TRINITY_DN10861_c0_g1~~TRINITY_DN10861_c0_g1_i1.p1  ORF type:complete len:1197 (-),score=113.57 TRINITY_DN10861_c0_g1_i1:120-3491(-)